VAVGVLKLQGSQSSGSNSELWRNQESGAKSRERILQNVSERLFKGVEPATVDGA
jgi:hypothetical protein